MWDGHFTNISVEIWIQSLNMYGFFGLSSNLRGVLVDFAKVIDGGQWMMEIFTMSKYGRGVRFGVFFDPLPEGPGCFPDVRGVTTISLAFPVVDNVLLLFCGDLVFGMH